MEKLIVEAENFTTKLLNEELDASVELKKATAKLEARNYVAEMIFLCFTNYNFTYSL